MATNDPIDIESVLQLGTGIPSDDRSQVIDAFTSLESHLRGFDPPTLELEAWVKNRGDDDQTVYLAVRAKGVDLVAHDQSPDFQASLLEARTGLRRQLSDHHDRRTNTH